MRVHRDTGFVSNKHFFLYFNSATASQNSIKQNLCIRLGALSLSLCEWVGECVYALLTLAALPVHSTVYTQIFLILFFGSACLIFFFRVCFFSFHFIFPLSCTHILDSHFLWSQRNARSNERTILHTLNAVSVCRRRRRRSLCGNRCVVCRTCGTKNSMYIEIVCLRVCWEREYWCVLSGVYIDFNKSLSCSRCDGPIIWTPTTTTTRTTKCNSFCWS